jgi:hypothetical protein
LNIKKKQKQQMASPPSLRKVISNSNHHQIINRPLSPPSAAAIATNPNTSSSNSASLTSYYGNNHLLNYPLKSPCALLSMPPEILHKILLELPFKDQIAVSKTCRTLYTALCHRAFSQINRLRFMRYVSIKSPPKKWLCEATDAIYVDKIYEAETLFAEIDKCMVLNAKEVTCRMVRSLHIPWMMSWLPKCSNIRLLDLAGTPLGDDELNQIAKMFESSLESLVLSECNELSKSSLRGLTGCKQLSFIDVSGCNQFDDLTPLFTLPRLKVIRFANPRKTRWRSNRFQF